MNLEEATINELIKLDESIKEDKTHKLIEMSEITRKKDMIIKVFGREGYVQHFHIYMKDGRKSCLQFKKNAYFLHNQYKDTLTNNELEFLMDLMKQESLDMPGKTNWEASIIIWNMNNASSVSKKKLELNLEMPYYKNPEIEK